MNIKSIFKLLLLISVIYSFNVYGLIKYRRPFSASVGVNYGFDNDGSRTNNSCKDYTCRVNAQCYDGHRGTDFPVSIGTNILAPASGTVVTTYNGCSNYGSLHNTCGNYCGNYVKINHGSGYYTLFCHMKKDSIVVSKNQSVSCGQKIGQSASSGSSTGPHLHFGTLHNSTHFDPFDGTCAPGGTAWVSQGSYPHNKPSTSCGTICECTVGAKQYKNCGNCGKSKRTCASNCKWGSWGSCYNQGECAAGSKKYANCGNCGTKKKTCSSSCNWGSYGSCYNQGECTPNTTKYGNCGNCGTQKKLCNSSCNWSNSGGCNNQGECAANSKETKSCCDCGSTTRKCSNSCEWNTWSACSGEDPNNGNTNCETNKPGLCKAGKIKCINGCLTCKEIYEPTSEVCDDIDNNCDGNIDENTPELNNISRPEYGATLQELSYPKYISSQNSEKIWAKFKNDGLDIWYAGTVWLESENNESDLFSKSWRAYNIPVVIDSDIKPGEEVFISFDIKSNNKHEKSDLIKENFYLAFDAGSKIKCPAPKIETEIIYSEEITDNKDTKVFYSKNKTENASDCSFSSNNNINFYFYFLFLIFVVFRKKSNL